MVPNTGVAVVLKNLTVLLLGGLLASGAAAAPTTGPSSLRGNVPVGNEGWWG